MSQKSGIPLLGDLLRYLGAVPTIFVSLGFGFVTIAAFGDLALSNKKLLFGFLLIFFGLTCRYSGRSKIWMCHPPGSEFCTAHQYDGRRHLHIEWGDLGAFLLWLGAFLSMVYVFFGGRWPLL